jgi:hypothetical protein
VFWPDYNMSVNVLKDGSGPVLHYAILSKRAQQD